VPGNECSEHLFTEHSFPGAKVPRSEGSYWELSLRGAKIPGSEKSWYLCCQLVSIRLSDVRYPISY